MSFIYSAYKDGLLSPMSIEDADIWIENGFAIYRKEEEDGPEDDISEALSFFEEDDDIPEADSGNPLPDDDGLYPDDFTGDEYNESDSPSFDISSPIEEDVPVVFPTIESTREEDSEDGEVSGGVANE